jgi:ADP-heptose:LPS heptosyltransferase
MRRFNSVNHNGIAGKQKQVIRNTGHTQIYKDRNPSILRIDRLISDHKPSIMVTRINGGIGDVLMTTPTIRELSRKYDIKITYGTDFVYLDGALEKVLRYNPYIDNIIPWRSINKDEYDAVIDLTCPCIVHEKPGAPPINRIDLFARHIHINLRDKHIDYTISKEENIWANEYINSNNLSKYKYLVLVQPTSSALHRDIPVDKLKQCIINIVKMRRDVGFIIITNNSDNRKNINWKEINNVHVLDNFDCREIAALMKLCSLVICQDSAVLHLASALKMKTLALFGPTDPRARVNYHPEAVAYWPAGQLKGSPRWYDSSDGGLCWKLMDNNIIVHLIESLLNNTPIQKSRDFVSFGNYIFEEQIYEVL